MDIHAHPGLKAILRYLSDAGIQIHSISLDTGKQTSVTIKPKNAKGVVNVPVAFLDRWTTDQILEYFKGKDVARVLEKENFHISAEAAN